jgi:hypothetical protein
MCLICGDTICKANCNLIENPHNKNDCGNLNEHAFKKHNGISVFMDTKIPNITYVNYPVNLVTNNIYVNKYGEEI